MKFLVKRTHIGDKDYAEGDTRENPSDVNRLILRGLLWDPEDPDHPWAGEQEAEAKRIADEAEAKRIADEAEAKRIADEEKSKAKGRKAE